jgi:hypothetical protein
LANSTPDLPKTPSRVYNFDALGNRQDNDFFVGSGGLTFQIAEFHGDVIVTDGHNVYTGVGTLYQWQACGYSSRDVEAVTVNDQGIYVLTENVGCSGDGVTPSSSFDHFGFDDKLIESIPIAGAASYDEYGDNLSANDTEICQGNTVMNLDWTVKMTLPLNGAESIDCAITSNRIYVLAVDADGSGNPTGHAFISVFDTDGNYVDTIPDVPGETIAATDTDIYLSENDFDDNATTHVIAHYVRKVVRNPDKSIQSETFTHTTSDIQLTGVTGFSQAVFVDMLYVLDGPKQ